MKKICCIITVLLVLFPFCPRVSQAEFPLDKFALTESSFITAEEAAWLVWNIIEDDYSELFAPVSVDYNEIRIVAYVETKGLATELKAAYANGFDQNNPYTPWVEYQTSFLAAYNAIADELDANGRSDIYFEMWLCNDDSRSGKRSPFIQYLAYVTDRDYVSDNALFRYENTVQDVSELPTDIQPIHRFFKSFLELLGFDYVSLFYNEEDKRFIIEVAIKEVGENLYDAKQSGYDEKYVPWVELKEYIIGVYETMCAYLAVIGCDDISLIFELVNDEVHIGGYNDRISFDPLFSYTNGISLWDAME